ncbi:YdeI/OmpD-associated family protein [Nocardioides insulae]|uniref:YdeI/OmpD-associated family protein n=1 Tax=Nocardioides insulae TaxID=394734 RepID=UPI0004027861|nr:YdeI/OmpD-associated family protein [Nocardioides insulae]
MSMDHADAVFFEDAEAFEVWLADNASTASHVWVRIAKKGTGVRSVDWTTAVDVALCFGWIDGIARRIDDEWYVQRFTPRRTRSVWSKINRERIDRLTAEGRMRPAGLAEVERAKADGRWEAAYDGPATAVVPDDLAAALAARGLTDVFAALDGRNRFAVLNRIQTAVRAETRTRRIEKLTDALAQGKTPYPAPKKQPGT